MNIIDVAQGSPEWHALRCTRPTASEFSRIITATGRKSTQWDSYILDMVALSICPDHQVFYGNEHTERGKELEPEARFVFEQETGLSVEEVGFVIQEGSIAGCSPDGLIRGADGEFIAGLEIKCPIVTKHAGYIRNGIVPSDYVNQVHGSMAVTGLRQWYFMSYCVGTKPFILKVEWNHHTDRVKRAVSEFCEYYRKQRPKIVSLLCDTSGMEPAEEAPSAQDMDEEYDDII